MSQHPSTPPTSIPHQPYNIPAPTPASAKGILSTTSISANTMTTSAKALPKLILIPIIGAPAAGKGTISKLLVDSASSQQPIAHLSVGDMLRARVRAAHDPEDPDTTLLADRLRSAGLVPPETLIPMIKAELDEIRGSNDGYGDGDATSVVVLLDGFPRSKGQAALFEEMVQEFKFLIHIDCDEETAKKRFLSRNLEGRETDDEPLFRKRYEKHVINNAELLEHYGDEVYTVNSVADQQATYTKLLKRLSDAGVCSDKEGLIFFEE